MDSCNFFNFLLGTKLSRRATTELSKCYSSMTNGLASSSSSSLSAEEAARLPQGAAQTPPPSPLKQIQIKLANFAQPNKRPTTSLVDKQSLTEKVEPHPSIGSSKAQRENLSGTYRATLIPTVDSDDSDEERNDRLWTESGSTNGENQVAIVAYPSKDLTDSSYRLHYKECTNGDHLTQSDDLQQQEKDLRQQPESNVKCLIRSIESRSSLDYGSINGVSPIRSMILPRQSSECDTVNISPIFTKSNKPITLVKPLPPKLPPKSVKARCLNIQMIMNKPANLGQLFMDESFLNRLFHQMDPLDRCNAAQVCRKWRELLYSNKSYWQDLILIIDFTRIRREHLIDYIMSSLQTAKLNRTNSSNRHSTLERDHSISCKTHRGASVHSSISRTTLCSDSAVDLISNNNQPPTPNASQAPSYGYHNTSSSQEMSTPAADKLDDSFLFDLDQEDVWRIQELCNRYQQRSYSLIRTTNGQSIETAAQTNSAHDHQHPPITMNSKSSSIPSQISSTLSSYSLSSVLSPLQETSRMDKMKDKLYSSLAERGFTSICLYGATNEDIDDMVLKIPFEVRSRITKCRLNNCAFTDRGLEQLIGAFNSIKDLELSGCNDLTNNFELGSLAQLERLAINDCVNIADAMAQTLVSISDHLREISIQAYHLTDAFFEYLGTNANTKSLKRLEVPNCKEMSNQCAVTIAKYFPHLEALSISGSTKIADDGLEILVRHITNLRVLDLSWCSRITDISLEYIACDLEDTLIELVLDRNIHITDIGLSYLASMTKLKVLSIRWCSRVTDYGLETIVCSLKSLKHLYLAGIHAISARSLLSLVDTNLSDLELTNCPAANTELVRFLSSKMPNCNIIF